MKVRNTVHGPKYYGTQSQICTPTTANMAINVKNLQQYFTTDKKNLAIRSLNKIQAEHVQDMYINLDEYLKKGVETHMKAKNHTEQVD